MMGVDDSYHHIDTHNRGVGQPLFLSHTKHNIGADVCSARATYDSCMSIGDSIRGTSMQKKDSASPPKEQKGPLAHIHTYSSSSVKQATSGETRA